MLFYHVHICSHCEKRGDGDVSLMDGDGVAVEVVRTDVLDLLAGLEIHITLGFFEGIREVMRALIGEADAVDAIGNIYVIDEVIGEEPHLLSNATTISLDEVPELVSQFDGVCYPAHIDRDSGGIVAILGTLPDNLGFRTVEFRDAGNIKSYSERFGLSGMTTVTNSDAHFLEGIRDKEAYFDLPDGLSSPEEVRAELFKLLR